jgi:hypothetical protein
LSGAAPTSAASVARATSWRIIFLEIGGRGGGQGLERRTQGD